MPLPSDEVMRTQVNRQFDELVGHLPPDLADEARAAVDRGDVEWPPTLAEDTIAGRLAFHTSDPPRIYRLAIDPLDGGTCAQVTGTTEAGTYRNGELLIGHQVDPP
jgi:hypothetical protein